MTEEYLIQNILNVSALTLTLIFRKYFSRFLNLIKPFIMLYKNVEIIWTKKQQIFYIWNIFQRGTPGRLIN